MPNQKTYQHGAEVYDKRIVSEPIAVPVTLNLSLSADNGGVQWDEVKAAIKFQLNTLEIVNIHICMPFG